MELLVSTAIFSKLITMQKIETMSPGKWEQIPGIRQSLIDLEQQPLDRTKAKYWISRLYKSIGLSPPLVVFLDSPAAMHMAAFSFRGQLGGQLEGQISTQWLSSYLGWFQGAKLAGVRFDEAFGLYEGFLTNLSLTLPFERVCFCSDRPREVHWQDGLLHNEVGMSVRYADGWGVYSIEGVRVDEQIVMHPETQTVEQLNSEENEEIKRIRISKFGWHRYLEEARAEVVDVATPSHWMESLGKSSAEAVVPTGNAKTLPVTSNGWSQQG